MQLCTLPAARERGRCSDPERRATHPRARHRAGAARQSLATGHRLRHCSGRRGSGASPRDDDAAGAGRLRVPAQHSQRRRRYQLSVPAGLPANREQQRVQNGTILADRRQLFGRRIRVPVPARLRPRAGLRRAAPRRGRLREGSLGLHRPRPDLRNDATLLRDARRRTDRQGLRKGRRAAPGASARVGPQGAGGAGSPDRRSRPPRPSWRERVFTCSIHRTTSPRQRSPSTT